NQEGSFSLLRLFSKGAEIKLSHGVVREKNSRVGEQLGVGLGFSSERLYLEANLMRDVFANRDTLKSLQATYKGGCWEFGASFRESVEGARHIREAFLTLSVFDFRGLKLPISR
ncbi:MAG: hypothetical protein RMJ32_04530, partial [Aquificaceae bacterium]|nr:hypothetical protein [Aquificaceae bacterium]